MDIWNKQVCVYCVVFTNWYPCALVFTLYYNVNQCLLVLCWFSLINIALHWSTIHSQQTSSRGQQWGDRLNMWTCFFFLCLLVQSPCSIPLVSTLSTFLTPIHPQGNRNLLIQCCVIFYRPKWTFCLTRLRNCPLVRTHLWSTTLNNPQSIEVPG